MQLVRFFSTFQVGDGTNFVLVLCGALLSHAEELLRMGLSPAEVIDGYEMALQKSLDILPCKIEVDSNLSDEVVLYPLPH